MDTSVWGRSSVIGLAGVLVALVLVSVSSAGEFYEKGGLAIRGYDPVAYFTEQKPVKGSARYVSEYQGSEFHFASMSNRDAFQVDPAKFAPQYGGFCAFAVSKGYKAKIDPDAWSIVGGKLYLNYDTGVRELWSEDIPGNIQKADRNWPKVRVLTKVVQ